ncbi:MAG: hypothetical protein QM820_59095 [Minicystis sp.]
MPEVHHAPLGGKDGDPPAALRALRRFVEAGHELRDVWVPELEGTAQPRSVATFGGLLRELDAWLEAVEALPMEPAGAPYVLDLSNRDAARAWLAELRTQIDDAVSAGEDATRPPGRRALGRPTARRALLEARHSIEQMLVAAERGAATTET